MKITRMIVLSCFLSALMITGPACTGRKDKNLKGTITLSGAWALYPMAVKWSEEYQKLVPEVKIDISAGGAGKGMADCLAEVVDIGMVSREIYPEEIQKGAWWVSVTKDAVVPTVNSGNPVLQQLFEKGVTRECLVGIYIDGSVTDWGQVTKSGKGPDIHVYTRSDACGAAQTWAEYLGKKQEDLRDVGVYGDPGLAEAVRNDVLGIGFNNINYAYDAKTLLPLEGITILPIDLNGNGKLDNDENFYGSRDQVVQAIAAYKYPSPPARDLHFVSKGKPGNKIVQDFILWVLTEGQKYVAEAGYINLSDEKLNEGLNKLSEK